ncbi:hypothetical protein L210DRAFT_987153 [Boletus edulis BED1]|uniref:Uncharacterized protein n=1 Tax=Boletus edulis BED1 TaxID=1328754 RepID=A0AAD4C2N1_BOLED|nr:hypothetical protein L210DRAFT_987153 [Boletus edulis BED1]
MDRNSAYRLRLTPGWKSIHPVFNECFDSRELPRDENEWIRDEELGNAREAVKTFHRKHPSAPRPQKTMRVRFAGIDAACTCPICLDIPVPAPSGLFQSAEFLAFRAQFNRLPDYMFERPPRPEPK